MALYASQSRDINVPFLYPAPFSEYWNKNLLYVQLLGIRTYKYNLGSWDRAFVCPNAGRSYEGFPQYGGANYAYGMTYNGTTSITGASVDSWSKNQVTCLAKVRKPSQRFLFDERTDSGCASPTSGSTNLRDPANDGGWWQYGNTPPDASASRVAYRHGSMRKVNAIYLDGHGKAHDCRELIPAAAATYYYPYRQTDNEKRSGIALAVPAL